MCLTSVGLEIVLLFYTNGFILRGKNNIKRQSKVIRSGAACSLSSSILEKDLGGRVGWVCR